MLHNFRKELHNSLFGNLKRNYEARKEKQNAVINFPDGGESGTVARENSKCWAPSKDGQVQII
jgi:hypothetical protein